AVWEEEDADGKAERCVRVSCLVSRACAHGELERAGGARIDMDGHGAADADEHRCAGDASARSDLCRCDGEPRRLNRWNGEELTRFERQLAGCIAARQPARR